MPKRIPRAFSQGLSVISALYTILIELGYAISKSTTVGTIYHGNSLVAERCRSVVGNRAKGEKGKNAQVSVI